MERALRLRLLGLIHLAECHLAVADAALVMDADPFVSERITMAEGHLAEVQLLLHGQEVDPD